MTLPSVVHSCGRACSLEHACGRHTAFTRTTNQGVPRVTGGEAGNGGCKPPGPGGTEGGRRGQGPSFRVDPFRGNPCSRHPRQDRGRTALVHFETPHLVGDQACTAQCFGCGCNGGDRPHLRPAAGNRERHHHRFGAQAQVTGPFRTGDQQRGGAISLCGHICCGDGSAVNVHRHQGGQVGKRAARRQGFVAYQQAGCRSRRQGCRRHCDEVTRSVALGPPCPRLAGKGPRIEVGPTERPAPHHLLRCQPRWQQSPARSVALL